MSVSGALSHPWMQLADARKHGQLLTTNQLKEFKYRHQWVVSDAFEVILQKNRYISMDYSTG